MKSSIRSSDPELKGAWSALLRAAKNARKLSKASKTPFYVLRNGRIVDLNGAVQKKRQKR